MINYIFICTVIKKCLWSVTFNANSRGKVGKTPTTCRSMYFTKSSVGNGDAKQNPSTQRTALA